MPTTCASKILEGWVAPYDATLTSKLRAAGIPIDPQTPRSSDQSKCSFRAGAAHFERRRTAGFGQGTVREERTAPSCFGVADTSADDLRRQAANRAPAKIDLTSLLVVEIDQRGRLVEGESVRNSEYLRRVDGNPLCIAAQIRGRENTINGVYRLYLP